MRLKPAAYFFLMLSSLILLSGCDYYDKGFEDGHDGAEKSFYAIISDSYDRGYDDGQYAGYMYDRGRSDGANGNPPVFKNPDYLDGYEYAK